jgi:hypothetical protein
VSCPYNQGEILPSMEGDHDDRVHSGGLPTLTVHKYSPYLTVCNNPNFWEIEINGFIKIQNFGDNKNFYFKYKINFLSFKTCEFEHLLPCFK